MAGAGVFDWSRVAVVLRDFYRIELTGQLHRKLRTCMFEMLTIERDEREAKDDG
jgi:hypothetical protein